jgi:hypothetical protein
MFVTACAAGPASVSTEPVNEQGLVRFEFGTDGKNSFTVGGVTCSADRGGRCVVEVPYADLQAGWNEIEVETRRRTGEKEVLTARVFLGEDAFARTCEIQEQGGPDARTLRFHLSCTFEEGFAGVLFGEPMVDGKATVTAAEVQVDADPAQAGVLRPLVVGRLPLIVTNRAGGEWARPLSVVVPLPLVQLSVDGALNPWFEDVMPLRIRAEEGSAIVIDGESVRPRRDGASFTIEAEIKPGPNLIRIEATKEGRVPAVVELKIRGMAPDTPLYVYQPKTTDVVTTDSFIRIRGKTLPEAKLYLANRPMDLAADGSFELIVPLDEGENEVNVLAVVDPGRNVRARPPTRRTFHILVEDNRPPTQRTWVEEIETLPNEEVLAALARDPWSHMGAEVEFSLVVEQISTSLLKDGCESRIEGLACTHEVERDVRVGFEVVRARACDGELVPAVVEYNDCPLLERGQRLLVTGKVLGGLGGRVGQWTVERPRFRASTVEPAPWVVPEER